MLTLHFAQTTYTACQNPSVSFKFASGDSASDFHISLKETSTSSDTYTVYLASKEVTKSPKSFSIPVQTTYPFHPFQITDLSTFSPSGRPGNSPYSTINFTITDTEDGKASATTRCSTQWNELAGEKPPTGKIACADPSFVFQVTDYEGISKFTLGVSHSYSLKAGTKVTTSGSLAVDAAAADPNLSCQCGASGVCSCGIPDGKSPLLVPVTAVTGL